MQGSMALTPSKTELATRLLGDLRIGLPVGLIKGNARALIGAAETLPQDRLDAIRDLGAPHLAITSRRAAVLKAMVYDGDVARLMIPADVDTGWIRAMADPSEDLQSPLKGPFRAIREGSADLARAGIGFCKTARLLPAVVVLPLPETTGYPANLTVLDLDKSASATAPLPVLLAGAGVPLKLAHNTRVHVFGDGTGLDEHYAIEIGHPSREDPVLTRLHSACFTGDVLGSLKCDCGPQLDGALRQMASEGAGVLVYLNQEGRGIGLANKMRAYALQAQGFDTVEANHRLGFEDDERDFRIGAQILMGLGFASARLMTNNPAKVTRMEEAGLPVVERVPHRFGETQENTAYLATKAAKSGHLL